jgi:DNA invertase Pin-like site-specific DNA recombinase
VASGGDTINTQVKSPAAYVRISQDSEGKRLGVQRQRQDLKELAKSLGWGEPEFYEDNDRSASKVNGKRPRYDDMLADVEAGKRDGILVYTVDRLTRRAMQLETFIGWLETGHEQIRVPVETIERDDFRTSNGRMVLRIKGALAQQEAERMSERIRRAQQQRVESGQRITGSRFRPFGFTHPAAMEPISDEQDEIRGWYRAVLRGESIRSIVRGLKKREVPTVSGADWTQRVVKDCLMNYRNVGKQEYTYTDPTTKAEITGLFTAEWDAIVDEATFDAVRAKLSGNPGVGESRPRCYLLVGLMICGMCGTRLYVTSAGKRKPDGTFAHEARCFAEKGGCGKLARRYEPLERYIVAEHLKIAEAGRQLVLTTPGLREAMEAKHRAALAAANPAQDRADKLQVKMDEAKAQYEDGNMEAEDFYPMLRDLRAKLNEARKEAAEIAESVATMPSPDALLVEPSAMWEQATFDQRLAGLATSFETIAVHRSNTKGAKFDTTSVVTVRRKAHEPKVIATMLGL